MSTFRYIILILASILVSSVLYAQVSGTGSVVVLVASTPIATPTPTPTPTPSPGAGCPAGFTCGSPITAPAYNGGTLSYGAGSQPNLPTLKANPVVFTPVGGGSDNTSGLQTAVTNAHTAGTDVQIANFSGSASITGTVSVPSNVMIQCVNINTTLLQTTTNPTGPSMLLFSNTSGGGISNCTLQGQNGTAPPGNFACTPHFGPGSCTTSAGPGTTTAFLLHGDHASNIEVMGNIFKQTIAQCAFEDYCGGSGPSGCTGNDTSYNSFFNSTLYAVCYDNAGNSNVLHNYSLNGMIGHEMDNGSPSQVESGLTEFNYSVRNQFGTGTDVAEGQTGYFEGLFGGIKGNAGTANGNAGVTVQFNTVDGMLNSNFKTFLGQANGYNGVDGIYNNNACINGCSTNGGSGK